MILAIRVEYMLHEHSLLYFVLFYVLVFALDQPW